VLQAAAAAFHAQRDEIGAMGEKVREAARAAQPLTARQVS